MHDCPVCQEACDCDGEDHYNAAASIECVHECEQDEDERDLDDLGMPGYPDNPGPSCRVCDCTQERACEGGCIWAEADLCSRCVVTR